MNKTFLTLSAAALALTGTALLAQPRGPMTNPDNDGDGTVTRAEMQAHATDMFARMDANGDGRLDAEDRQAHQQQMFASADTDGDGELSQAEMQAMHAERAERREARAERRAERRADRMAEHFARMDSDKSGGLSPEELEALRGERGPMGKRGMRGGHGARGEGPAMLRMADSDGDEVVTRAEFDAALTAHFAKVDTDGDGTLSQAERDAAHDAMRSGRKAKREYRRGQ